MRVKWAGCHDGLETGNFALHACGIASQALRQIEATIREQFLSSGVPHIRR
jgi:hypothetical protein